ncbi:SAP30-binding protein, variant 2 [Basidiobolus ranarum]|uniref:SAP30-binding protein, variant 2 n=1 Tax=Basidiobolus ranarum TaxID=34480 RepID=A0ABR2VZJ4_9FUNG
MFFVISSILTVSHLHVVLYMSSLLGLINYSDEDNSQSSSEEEVKQNGLGLVQYGVGEDEEEELNELTDAKGSDQTNVILHKPLESRLSPNPGSTSSKPSLSFHGLVRTRTESPQPKNEPDNTQVISEANFQDIQRVPILREPEYKFDEDPEYDEYLKFRELLVPKTIVGIDNYGIPGEPEDECDPDLQAKIAKWIELKNQGISFNDRLSKNKAFRNPNIYDKFVQFIELDETGSNFPSDIYDPKGFPPEAYSNEIEKLQKLRAEERSRRQQQRAEIEFVNSNSRNSTQSSTSASTSSYRPSDSRSGK